MKEFVDEDHPHTDTEWTPFYPVKVVPKVGSKPKVGFVKGIPVSCIKCRTVFKKISGTKECPFCGNKISF
jgi:PHP family Zn ribbon phosphoesterase